MYLPQESVFHTRVYSGRRYADEELQKTKYSVSSLAKIVGFSVVLILLTVGGLSVLGIVTMQNQSATDNKMEAMKQDEVPKTNILDALDNEIKSLKTEFRQFYDISQKQMSSLSDNSSESRENLTSMNERLETLDTVVQTLRASQNNSDTTSRNDHVAIDRRLEELDNVVQTLRTNQSNSDAAIDRRLEELDTVVQTVRANQSNSDAAIDRRLEELDTAVQTLRANQSNSDTTSRNDHVAIDRRLDELDTDVQTVRAKQNSSDQFTETGGWELIFRATAGNGDNVYAAWTTGNSITDVKPSSMARGVSRHYRNTPKITEWSNVKLVKYSLFENSREVAYIIFDGTGSTNMDWFQLNRVLDSSWSAIASRTGTYNEFSISGTHGHGRRFYVNIQHGGCMVDKGYTVVSDTDSSANCPWVTHNPYPQFLYSVFNGPVFWGQLMHWKADYMAVFYRQN